MEKRIEQLEKEVKDLSRKFTDYITDMDITLNGVLLKLHEKATASYVYQLERMCDENHTNLNDLAKKISPKEQPSSPLELTMREIKWKEEIRRVYKNGRKEGAEEERKKLKESFNYLASKLRVDANHLVIYKILFDEVNNDS